MARQKNTIAIAFWVGGLMSDYHQNQAMLNLHASGVYEAAFTEWQMKVVEITASFHPDDVAQRQAAIEYAIGNIKALYGAKKVKDIKVLMPGTSPQI